jgi:uncharacterized phage protein (TIGR01671 family)
MRTIKFRGLRLDGKGWVVGSLLCPHAGNESTYIIGCNGSDFEVKPETVGQFTGLTDRDGKEIWEGDLVRYHFQNSWYKAEMIFNDGAFRIRGWSHGQLTHTFEVAGNIHE